MLPLAVAFQRLQPAAWGDPQVLQGPGAMEVQQLPAGDSLKGSTPGHVHVSEQRAGLLGPERSNHRRGVYYAQRNMSSVIGRAAIYKEAAHTNTFAGQIHKVTVEVK